MSDAALRSRKEARLTSALQERWDSMCSVVFHKDQPGGNSVVKFTPTNLGLCKTIFLIRLDKQTTIFMVDFCSES